MVLPHEHVVVDLRTPDVPGQGVAAAADVVALMAPQVRAAMELGVTALVECSTGGVGRRVDLDHAVSEATGLPIVVATGIYREPWLPGWALRATEAELRDWMLSELEDQVKGTGVRAAWIKLSAGDDGITDVEAGIFRAAVAAARRTGATIGSHTIRGRVVRDQLDLLRRAGGDPRRFVWIHAQAEPDRAWHRELAAEGVWLSYDDLGAGDDAEAVTLILRALEDGFAGQLLLSHDAGWYDPAQPGGGTPRPYTHLSSTILPMLRAAGIDEATLTVLTHGNPFVAFAR